MAKQKTGPRPAKENNPTIAEMDVKSPRDLQRWIDCELVKIFQVLQAPGPPLKKKYKSDEEKVKAAFSLIHERSKSDGQTATTALRLAQKIGLKNLPPKPTGPFTLQRENDFLEEIHKLCREQSGFTPCELTKEGMYQIRPTPGESPESLQRHKLLSALQFVEVTRAELTKGEMSPERATPLAYKANAYAREAWPDTQPLEKYRTFICADLASYLNDLQGKILDELHGKPTRSELNPTKKKIISMCRKKPLPASAICRKLELSPDHTRRVLAQLMTANLLKNGPLGYRTMRAT